jgi:hypothetical protein
VPVWHRQRLPVALSEYVDANVALQMLDEVEASWCAVGDDPQGGATFEGGGEWGVQEM